jgi:hypothetical protein
VAVAVFVASMLMIGGCARKAANPPKPAAQNSAVPLPEWAPKNPSPEFLRANCVLQPVPAEFWREYAQGETGMQAMLKRYFLALPAAYEFFGTLSDEQIERFRSTRVVRTPVRLLTPKQRAAFETWLDVYQKAMKGTTLGEDDFLVFLYKCGARKDFSNVEVGFDAQAGNAVQIKCWVRQPDGKTREPSTLVATMPLRR